MHLMRAQEILKFGDAGERKTLREIASDLSRQALAKHTFTILVDLSNVLRCTSNINILEEEIRKYMTNNTAELDLLRLHHTVHFIFVGLQKNIDQDPILHNIFTKTVLFLNLNEKNVSATFALAEPFCDAMQEHADSCYLNNKNDWGPNVPKQFQSMRRTGCVIKPVNSNELSSSLDKEEVHELCGWDDWLLLTVMKSIRNQGQQAIIISNDVSQSKELIIDGKKVLRNLHVMENVASSQRRSYADALRPNIKYYQFNDIIDTRRAITKKRRVEDQISDQKDTMKITNPDARKIIAAKRARRAM